MLWNNIKKMMVEVMIGVGFNRQHSIDYIMAKINSYITYEWDVWNDFQTTKKIFIRRLCDCEGFTMFFMAIVKNLYKIKPNFLILKRFENNKKLVYHAVCEIDNIIYDATANKKFYLANSNWTLVIRFKYWQFNFVFLGYRIAYIWNRYIMKKEVC